VPFVLCHEATSVAPGESCTLCSGFCVHFFSSKFQNQREEEMTVADDCCYAVTRAFNIRLLLIILDVISTRARAHTHTYFELGPLATVAVLVYVSKGCVQVTVG
jgi:hypothetical protein